MAPQVEISEVLLFEEAGWRYALPAEQVVEVVRAVTAPPLPRAPSVVEGVIDYRGVIVPLLDVRARFCLPARPMAASDHLVVARAGERLVAIRAERALGLVRLPPGALQDAESIASGTAWVAGVARLPDGLVVVHDLATFLSQAELLELSGALEERAGEGRAP